MVSLLNQKSKNISYLLWPPIGLLLKELIYSYYLLSNLGPILWRVGGVCLFLHDESWSLDESQTQDHAVANLWCFI